MIVRLSPLLCVALLAALLLAACGGSEETSTGGSAIPATTSTEETDEAASTGGEDAAAEDSQQVSEAIEALLTNPDNELVCDQVLTAEQLAISYGDGQGCRKQRKSQLLSDDPGIKKVEVDGDMATAVAVPKGGFYDGVKLEIDAVKVDGSWRISTYTAPDYPVGP